MLTDLIVESSPEVIQVSSITQLQHLYGSRDDLAVWDMEGLWASIARTKA